MNDTDTKHKDEIIERPARAWFNWWLITERSIDNDGYIRRAGEVAASRVSFPSKDVAEAAAADGLVAQNAEAPGVLIYLGAYPEGVRP